MPPVNCLKCAALIPPADVNVSDAVAFCAACGELSRLSDILEESEFRESSLDVDLTNPPRGCRLVQDIDAVRATVSLRSLSSAGGLLVFTLFWNGIVSIFVALAIAGTLNLIFGSVPAWFPAPNMNGQPMGLGMVIFLWLFLTPFITIGTVMVLATVTALIGRCEVRIKGDRGVVFTGFGPIGWKRRFDALNVKSVKLGRTTWKENDQAKPCIVIEANKTIRLGSNMPDDRRLWLTATLRDLLLENRSGHRN